MQQLADPLDEGIKQFRGQKREFLLLRVSGLDKKQALITSGTPEGTYNNWLHKDPRFVVFYRRVDELSVSHRKQAITFLRRDNQLQAVLLEGKIIDRMKEEVESGEYVLLRTHLAREVYTRLLNEVDFQPAIRDLTWEDKRKQLFVAGDVVHREGDIIDGEFTEAESSEETQSTKGFALPESEQGSPQTEETNKG